MTVPINSEVDSAPPSPPSIGPEALADLLGRWPTADGALYRLLAARIGRLADTGELPAGVRLPPERALAASQLQAVLGQLRALAGAGVAGDDQYLACAQGRKDGLALRRNRQLAAVTRHA